MNLILEAINYTILYYSAFIIKTKQKLKLKQNNNVAPDNL